MVIYDPKCDSWATGPDLPRPLNSLSDVRGRCSCSAAVLNGEIYIIDEQAVLILRGGLWEEVVADGEFAPRPGRRHDPLQPRVCTSTCQTVLLG